jgi:hypothetical protein
VQHPRTGPAGRAGDAALAHARTHHVGPLQDGLDGKPLRRGGVEEEQVARLTKQATNQPTASRRQAMHRTPHTHHARGGADDNRDEQATDDHQNKNTATTRSK